MHISEGFPIRRVFLWQRQEAQWTFPIAAKFLWQLGFLYLPSSIFKLVLTYV